MGRNSFMGYLKAQKVQKKKPMTSFLKPLIGKLLASSSFSQSLHPTRAAPHAAHNPSACPSLLHRRSPPAHSHRYAASPLTATAPTTPPHTLWSLPGMGKTSYKRLKGGQSFRQRLLLATLSSSPIIIEDIRTDETWPGLHSHEISLLRLFETVCDDCVVQINETGTKLKYKPGIIMGGTQHRPHDCGVSRSIGYFLEPLIVLGLFAKKALTITLKGVTNDSKDPSVDTFKSTALPMLKRFGVPSEGLSLKIESRGVPPNGGGEVILSLPSVQSLSAVNWTDEGFVKKIRGITFSTKVSAQFENSMIKAARRIINPLLSDVHIFSDHRSGPQAGNSPGYGISLVAETTSGCFISADTAISHARHEETSSLEDDVKKGLMPPEDVGEGIAKVLLGEIAQGGVVDSTHQGLLFLLCALCPQDFSKIRVGKLSQHGVETLRNIRDFLDLKFVIKPDPQTQSVLLKCIGYGMKNLSRKIS